MRLIIASARPPLRAILMIVNGALSRLEQKFAVLYQIRRALAAGAAW
jgi:hypothetical protein